MYELGADALASLLGDRLLVSLRLLSLTAAGDVRSVLEGRLLGGNVSSDVTRDIRRDCSLQLENVDGSLGPQQPGDAFFGGERFGIHWGLTVRAGQTVWIPLIDGYVTGFRADSSGVLSVTGQDRFQALAQPFADTWTVQAGTPAAEAARALLAPILDPGGGGADWDLDDDGRTTPLRVFAADEERLGAVVQLFRDLGLELFADRIGRPVLRPLPDPTRQPVVRTYDRSPRTAAMLELSRSGDRRPYNRVVVIAQPPDGSPYRAVAEVTDEASPIHPTRIGVRTAPIYRSARIPDQVSANAVAAALLLSYALYEDEVSSPLVPDPTLDPGDVVRFKDTVTGTQDGYVVQQLTLQLGPGSRMTVSGSRVLPVFREVA